MAQGKQQGDAVIRVGVIGLGKGLAHARELAADPRVDLVALCDIDRDRVGAAAAELGGAQAYVHPEALFDSRSVDAVTIATPNDTHLPLVLRALEAQLHVLCEKPLALDAKQTRQMAAAAAAAQRTLMVNYSYRYVPVSQALAEQVRSGALGEVYYGRSVWHRRWGVPPGWFSDKARAGGGPLIDLGVHRLDLALWLMGFPRAVTVSAAAYDHLARAGVTSGRLSAYSVEDLATAFVRFDSGATLMLEASWALHQPARELMETWLYGTRGGLLQRNVGEGYTFAGQLFSPGASDSFLSTDVLPGSNHHASAQREFAAVVAGDIPPTQRLEESIAVMEIIDAIYRSAAAGAEVRVADA